MNKRDKFIIILFVLGFVSYFSIDVFIDSLAVNEEQNLPTQLNALEHDFTTALQYKSKYMGDFVNLNSLNGSLPLTNRHPFTLELNPEVLSANIVFAYNLSSSELIELERDFIYSAIANLVLIENLEKITYQFNDYSYSLTKADTENWYNIELTKLQSEQLWKNTIQSTLSDNYLVGLFFEKVVIVSSNQN
ncbi:DUF4825 domain-containing protein [Paenibacillus xylanexedens]|uniref:DUF4825 domain-containing protein n=1 Tax=Paenibacillus xylanexedens TaxID=528191 RepID=UPI003D023B36